MKRWQDYDGNDDNSYVVWRSSRNLVYFDKALF